MVSTEVHRVHRQRWPSPGSAPGPPPRRPTFGVGGEGMEIEVVVEIPKGSRNKYESDDEGRIWLDRTLFTATSYPEDYGYVAGTLAADGDPLDALVLLSESTFPGCRIRARPVGMFLMSDEEGTDAKIHCVVASDP